MIAPQQRLKKIGFNTFAVLGGEVLNKAGIFLVYAILARRAGVHEFGQLSLGLLLLYTFHVFAVAGLPVALTREVAKRPRAAKRLLLHGYLAAILPAALSVLTMVGLAFAMQYESDTIVVIALLALAVPAYALTMITEAVIKGREQMQWIAVGNVPGNLFLVVFSFAVLASGYGVVAVAGVVVASRVITLFCMHMLLWINATDCRSGRVRLRFCWLLLKHSLVFLGTDGVQAVGASLSALLLSKFATEREVGLLGAAFQLMQPIQMFYRSVGHSSFPPLVAAAKASGQAVARLSSSILGLILWLAFPAALATYCLSSDVLASVYGNSDFRDAAIVMQILAVTLLLDPLNPVLGHGLWAMGRDRTVFRIVIVNVVSGALIGVLLIGQFGLIGAAYTALAGSFINTAQHFWCFERGVGSMQLGREVLRISPAALSAITCLVVLPLHPYAALTVALSVYLGFAFFRFDQFPLRSRAI